MWNSSKILKQGGDLEMLLRHFDSDVLNAGNRNTRSSASSHVIMQETAQKIRLLHSKFSQDTSSFPWERRLKTPPDACPEAECDVIQSYSTGEDDGKDEGEDNTGLILYGYGTEVPDSDIRVTANLSLGRIFNILWLLPYHYPGIQTPYTYYGWTHSMFSIHVEDALTWSVNYMFMGGMKIWVVVPPHASALLEYHLQRGSPISDSKCRNILGHKTVMPTVGWLRDHAIPFKIVHLDVAPLVAAFRPDLLQSLLKNKVIVTPQTMTGMELLVKDIHKYGINTALPPISTQEDERSLDEGTSMFNCPVSECGLTFGNSSHDLIKRAMVKHVKSSHRPIILSDNLLFKISRLFPSKRKTAL
ncbi:Lysine-specific demethylase 4D [Frankliniella fusca]|uniref:Lysine-specific demethylase 4D n=1 Tax=Frankliniella fusca TaxID=407009 RepID=A0AAE1L9N4_9NEOP|nr:Lysine-specific demethylase 4D [Frankliniella fusca]